MDRFIFRTYYKGREFTSAHGISLAQLVRFIGHAHSYIALGHPVSYEVEGMR